MAEQEMAAADDNSERHYGMEENGGKSSSAKTNSSARQRSRSEQRLSSLKHHLQGLTQSGKIERAALLDFHGVPIIQSPGMDISSDDGATILRTLDCPTNPMTKLKVGKQDFVCFKNCGDGRSLVGQSDYEFLCIYRGSEFLVVGISDPTSPGSSIYEINRFLSRFKESSAKTDVQGNC